MISFSACKLYVTSMGNESLDRAVINVGRLILRAPEQDTHFAPIHENEALALMRHVCAHAAPHDAVPSRQVHLIEFSLNDLSDIVEYAALVEGECDAVNCVLLHVRVHICILDHGILGFLLVCVTVRLHHLRIGLSLPGFRLRCLRVCYNLRHCSHALLPRFFLT